MPDPSANSAHAAPRFLVELPRWLFLIALVFAPWAYGSTPLWAIACLESLLGVILAVWLSVNSIRRLKPQVHPVLQTCSLILLAYGWAMTLNAHFQVDTADLFTPVRALIPWAPGTIDRATSVSAMLRMTCLLGTACFICDLSARRIWRQRIWRTMAATGVTLVLFGLLQSAFAQPLLVWRREDSTVPYFATYYYHGNAGSLINLVLPLVAGRAALTLRTPDSHAGRAFWFPGLFICIAGAFVNVSRSAMSITVLMCFVLLLWQFYGEPRNELLPPRRLRWVYAILMIGIVTCLVAFSGWERPAQKWALMRTQLNSANKRLVATRVCLRMFPDAHWHGFGPGTFALVFPHYTGTQAGLIPGIWRYSHDDYLQAIIEWGWLGGIPLAILFFGAMVTLFLHWRQRRDFSFSDRVLVFASGLALVGVAIHSFMDFPLQIASLQLYASVFVGFGWGCGEWSGIRAGSIRSSDSVPVSQ